MTEDYPAAENWPTSQH